MKNYLPESVAKYFNMSRRERKHEMQSALWYMPALYISIAITLAAVSLYLDLGRNAEQYAPDVLRIHADTTQMLVSTLIGGILTLSAFTLNSLLVFLTTFSGQFSPRMLLNFIADKKTQHALGIFNGSFVYVLLVFLFIGSTEIDSFSVVPMTTIFLAFFTSVTFIYFINHASTWMQVYNITDTMKTNSEEMMKDTLSNELEVYRRKDAGDLKDEFFESSRHLYSRKSGYIQLINYREMIEAARKTDIVIEFHFGMGDWVLDGNQLLSIRGKKVEEIDVEKFHDMIRVGHKEIEIQDLRMGMHKLAEVAIKSLGNSDPKTAVNALHQMSGLMMEVVTNVTFTPYLADENGETRLIVQADSFESYLYEGYGFIRHYCADDHLILAEMAKSFRTMAETLGEDKAQILWEFAEDSLECLDKSRIFHLDRKNLVQSYRHLARATGNETMFAELEKELIPASPQA
ncbi:DUF2254 domain-containing protein [Alkalicoccus chagannorensis]|uniref:DUF2254 domain-containing protein n=1 Tax=Alkalicoccus chagannorensis TaxID=427072 RepID=UPI00047A7466|nr:DUF2254 domain-containing protein [Alkalicoccus chagannorensis]